MDDLLQKALPRRETVEELLRATGDLGKASGLDAAVAVMIELAKMGKRVDASEIRMAAAALEASAKKHRTRANAVLNKQGA